jgi:hypothetical protein
MRKKPQKSEKAAKPVRKFTRKNEDYEPTGEVCPHIPQSEAPSEDDVISLLKAGILGLSIDTAAAYAELPTNLVRNWLTRGRNEEQNPFKPNIEEDKESRDKRHEYFTSVTLPCFILWVKWKKARAQFVMKNVSKIQASKNWTAKAWLLERAEPSLFVIPGKPPAVKREEVFHEKEAVTLDVRDPNEIAERVVIMLPDNGRKSA